MLPVHVCSLVQSLALWLNIMILHDTATFLHQQAIKVVNLFCTSPWSLPSSSMPCLLRKFLGESTRVHLLATAATTTNGHRGELDCLSRCFYWKQPTPRESIHNHCSPSNILCSFIYSPGTHPVMTAHCSTLFFISPNPLSWPIVVGRPLST